MESVEKFGFFALALGFIMSFLITAIITFSNQGEVMMFSSLSNGILGAITTFIPYRILAKFINYKIAILIGIVISIIIFVILFYLLVR